MKEGASPSLYKLTKVFSISILIRVNEMKQGDKYGF